MPEELPHSNQDEIDKLQTTVNQQAQELEELKKASENAYANRPEPPSETKFAQEAEEKARKKAEEAVKLATDAEEQVKEVEEQLQDQLESSKEKLDSAKRNLEQANAVHENTLNRIEGQKPSSNEAPTVAGYNPGDLFDALSVPPDPNPNAGVEQAPLSYELQQTQEETEKSRESLKKTEKQIDQADQYIQQVHKKTESNLKLHETFIQKLGNVFNESPDPGMSPFQAVISRPYYIFLIFGAVFTFLGLLLLLITQTLSWLIFIIAGVLLIGMGAIVILKN